MYTLPVGFHILHVTMKFKVDDNEVVKKKYLYKPSSM